MFTLYEVDVYSIIGDVSSYFSTVHVLPTGPPAADQIKREISKQTSECAACCSGKTSTVSFCESTSNTLLNLDKHQLLNSILSCNHQWWNFEKKSVCSSSSRYTFLSCFPTSGDVWYYSGWEPAGRCVWTLGRVPGGILACYTHFT